MAFLLPLPFLFLSSLVLRKKSKQLSTKKHSFLLFCILLYNFSAFANTPPNRGLTQKAYDSKPITDLEQLLLDL
jgi:hypothetical protein